MRLDELIKQTDEIGKKLKRYFRVLYSLLPIVVLALTTSILKLILKIDWIISLDKIFSWLFYISLAAMLIYSYIVRRKYAKYRLSIQHPLMHGTSTAIVVLIAIGVISGFIMWIRADMTLGYNPDFGGLIGGISSGVATLFLIRYTLGSEARRQMQKARISARLLCDNLEYIDNQIALLPYDGFNYIQHLDKWIDIYYDIAYVIENDYLPSIQNEYSYVQKLNSAISQNDHVTIWQIINERRVYYESYLCKYNADDLYENLWRISQGWKAMPAWDTIPENINKIKEIKELYNLQISNFIANLFTKYPQMSFPQIEEKLFEWLNQYSYFQAIVDKRIVSKACLGIFYNLPKKS